MADTRRKDRTWIVTDDSTGARVGTWDQVQVALLMDLRDELKKLNALLHCHNFVAIPQKLDAIKRNTTKKKRPKKQTPKLRVVNS